MKKILFILVFFSVTTILSARELVIDNVTPNDDYTELTFSISWKNTWRQGERFHDAVWVFAKYRPDNGSLWSHVYVDTATAPLLDVITQDDRMGIFLRSPVDVTSAADIPNTTVTLQIDLDSTIAIHPDFKVYGIEMVYVPEGPFWAGDGTPGSLRAQLNVNNQLHGYRPYIMGERKASLFTSSGVFSPVHPPQVTGYNSFYCMKYPITQGQFVDFLNILPEVQQLEILQLPKTVLLEILNGDGHDGFAHLYPFGNPNNRRQGIILRGYNEEGGFLFANELTIDKTYNNDDDGQNIAMNFLSEADHESIYGLNNLDKPILEAYLRYLNWAGLRPMSELEYEKACRGPLFPVMEERAWGNAKYGKLEQADISFSGNPYEESTAEIGFITNDFSYRVGMEAEPGDSRIQSEASYWGIMDLSGNGYPILASIESTLLGHKQGNGEFEHSYFFSTDFDNVEEIGSNVFITRLSGKVSEASENFFINPDFMIDGEKIDGVVQGRGVRQP